MRAPLEWSRFRNMIALAKLSATQQSGLSRRLRLSRRPNLHDYNSSGSRGFGLAYLHCSGATCTCRSRAWRDSGWLAGWLADLDSLLLSLAVGRPGTASLGAALALSRSRSRSHVNWNCEFRARSQSRRARARMSQRAKARRLLWPPATVHASRRGAPTEQGEGERERER